MQINNVSFPYPVLGIPGDVDGHFGINQNVTQTGENIEIELELKIHNETLEKLLSDKDASFCVEVICQQTLLRESIMFFEKAAKISLDANKLRNYVKVNIYIVALDAITNYQIKGSNSDYASYFFEIFKGDVLAIGAGFKFFVHKNWQSMAAASPFIEIVEGKDDEGPIKYDLTMENIIVELPKQDFEKYISATQNRILYPVLHSSIALPALIFALYQILDNPEYEDSDWYEFLKYKRDSDPKLASMWGEKSNIPNIAQSLLKNPISRELDSLQSLAEPEVNLEE